MQQATAGKCHASLYKLSRALIASASRPVASGVPPPGLEQTMLETARADVVVAGSVAVDLACNYCPTGDESTFVTTGTSNPAVITQSFGGVGQNIAVAASYAGADVRLCSIIANDIPGQMARAYLQRQGLSLDGIHVAQGPFNTAQYVAVNDKHKDLFVAMADMHIMEETRENFEQRWKSKLEAYRPSWLVIDANWNKDVIRKWVDAGSSLGARIAFEPVSVEKSTRIFYKTWKDHMEGLLRVQSSAISPQSLWMASQLADLATPNEMELMAMSRRVDGIDAWTASLSKLDESFLLTHMPLPNDTSNSSVKPDILLAALRLLSSIPCVLTKLGARGVLLTEMLHTDDVRLQSQAEAKYIFFRKASSASDGYGAVFNPFADPQSNLSGMGGVYMRLYPPVENVPAEDILSVNGVGDTFLGVLIAAKIRFKDRPISDLVDIAQQAAVLTLKSEESVGPTVRRILDSISYAGHSITQRPAKQGQLLV